MSFDLPISVSLAFGVFFLSVVYYLLIYPFFVSPLRKIPTAHPLAAITSLWINWQRIYTKENAAIHTAFQKLGPIVRLGPNEIAVNCIDGGVKAVYAGGFEKDDWYANSFWNYGVANMFSTILSKPHSVRKRMISNIYSKSVLQSSETMYAVSSHVIYARLLPLLSSSANDGGPMDIYFLLNRTTMDLVTAYQFGIASSSNFLQNEAEARRWLYLYRCRHAFTFWPSEHPRFTEFCKRFGISLAPSFVSDANRELEEWTLRRIDLAEAQINSSAEKGVGNPLHTPFVYQQLRAALQAEKEKPTAYALSPPSTPLRLELASEFFDHLSAGHETSAITLVYLFHELAQRPALQKSLRDELLTLEPIVDSSTATKGLPPPKEVDSLPLLHAIIMETLRRHAAIPGPQPRTTPANATIGPYSNIPAGVRISAQAWSLHRNEAVFPWADEWIPERWLVREEGDDKVGMRPTEAQLREMHRWFWAFGSGGRMCIGSNLAMQQMKLIVAAIVTGFRIEIVDDEGIEQEDAFTAQPKGGKLIVRLEKWET